MSGKACKACGEFKLFECYSKKLNGLRSKCKECCKAEHKAWHAKNRESQLEKKSRHYMENRDEALRRQAEYYQANRDSRLQYAADYRASNQDKIRAEYEKNAEKYKSHSKAWRESNPGFQRVIEVARRRARSKQTPPWADRKAMAAIYRKAREMRAAGIDCHVDHTIPLRGKTVSGLHVETNLQIIPASENLRKGAKLMEGS